MKEIENLEEVKANMKNPFMSVVSRSFYDITYAQIKDNRSNHLAMKYSLKWKTFVKCRKQARSIAAKGRFWPGE